MSAALVQKRGLPPWPEIPAVYGWLALDGRGNWLLRDAYDSMRFQRVSSPAFNRYIASGYVSDAQGRWYFQNGPQRVYVRLHRTPLVFRFEDEGWRDHCGQPAGRITAAWLDEAGAVVLRGVRGAGVVDDRDLRFLADMLINAGGGAVGLDSHGGGLLLRCKIHDKGQAEFLPLRPLRESSFERTLGFVADPVRDPISR